MLCSNGFRAEYTQESLQTNSGVDTACFCKPPFNKGWDAWYYR
jgi:hypothetical protein